MPFDIFVMYRFTVLVLLLVVRSDSTPTYFGHLDPDINCVFHAIGRYIFSGGIFAEGGWGWVIDVYE